MNRVGGAARLWSCLPLDRREMRCAIAAMCAALEAETGTPSGPPEIIITDDAGSEECNGKHLGRPGPTNILSFPLTAQNGVAGMLGSLMLSVTVLRRESLLYGQEPREHCLRLLAHGLAHLAGFEHGREMWKLCARLEETGARGIKKFD